MMEAFSERKSASVIFPGNVTSEHDPTEIWLRLRPSPVTCDDQIRNESGKTEIQSNAFYLWEERRPFDVFVSESNGNFVFARRGWQIVHRNGSVLVVFIINLKVPQMLKIFAISSKFLFYSLQLCLDLRPPSTILQHQRLLLRWWTEQARRWLRESSLVHKQLHSRKKWNRRGTWRANLRHSKGWSESLEKSWWWHSPWTCSPLYFKANSWRPSSRGS